jgi:hypothetical protein
VVGREWSNFTDELIRWRDLDRLVEFWWRDDDACRPNPALDRLYSLAATTGVPLGLAAIPDLAEPTIFSELPANVSVLQHGADHRNRAAGVEKKTEFSAEEPVVAALERLAASRVRLERVAPGRVLPVLVPPWNRLSPGLLPRLTNAGFRGLSTFGVRNVTKLPPGLKQVNTHVDIIDWKVNRGFCGAQSALSQATKLLAARRVGELSENGPIGWLTHHAVHDSAAWDFLESLFEATRGAARLCWRTPQSLFDGESS